jgi:hypothetical protein
VGLAKQIDSQVSSGNAGPVTGAGGPLILGIPMEMLGWIVAAAGLVIAGAGSRMHQVAVAGAGAGAGASTVSTRCRPRGSNCSDCPVK